jgi:hypothetical protein
LDPAAGEADVFPQDITPAQFDCRGQSLPDPARAKRLGHALGLVPRISGNPRKTAAETDGGDGSRLNLLNLLLPRCSALRMRPMFR